MVIFLRLKNYSSFIIKKKKQKHLIHYSTDNLITHHLHMLFILTPYYLQAIWKNGRTTFNSVLSSKCDRRYYHICLLNLTLSFSKLQLDIRILSIKSIKHKIYNGWSNVCSLLNYNKIKRNMSFIFKILWLYTIGI